MARVDIYIADDGIGPGIQERWGGYMVTCKGFSIYGTMSSMATENNMIINTMIAALDRFTRPAEITIHIESDWIIGRLVRIEGRDGIPESNLDIWQRNGWKTARGTEVKNKNEWQRLYNKLRVFEQAGGTFDYEKLEDEEMIGRIESLIESAKKNDG